MTGDVVCGAFFIKVKITENAKLYSIIGMLKKRGPKAQYGPGGHSKIRTFHGRSV